MAHERLLLRAELSEAAPSLRIALFGEQEVGVIAEVSLAAALSLLPLLLAREASSTEFCTI